MQKDNKMLQPGENGVTSLSGTRIRVERTGDRVQIHLQCGGDYQAIELYDRLVEGAQKGKVVIEITKS